MQRGRTMCVNEVSLEFQILGEVLEAWRETREPQCLRVSRSQCSTEISFVKTKSNPVFLI